MRLDSGYRCQNCGSKTNVNLYNVTNPKTGEQCEQILCLASRWDLQDAGYVIEPALPLTVAQ